MLFSVFFFLFQVIFHVVKKQSGLLYCLFVCLRNNCNRQSRVDKNSNELRFLNVSGDTKIQFYFLFARAQTLLQTIFAAAKNRYGKRREQNPNSQAGAIIVMKNDIV